MSSISIIGLKSHGFVLSRKSIFAWYQNRMYTSSPGVWKIKLRSDKLNFIRNNGNLYSNPAKYPVQRNMSTSSNKGPNEEVHSHSHAEETSSSADSHSHSHSGGNLFSHSHSHSHQSNELLMAASKDGFFKNPAVRITWIGLLVNIGMAVSKGIGGVYFHSQSLIADAIHSVSDMVADFLTLATVNVSEKIGSPTHFPLGYGKLETVGSLMVSGVLLFAGISVGWSSMLSIFEYTLPTYLYEYASMIQIGHSHSHTALPTIDDASHGHSHSHSHSHMDVANSNIAEGMDTPISLAAQSPSIAGAWLAGASILVKELLFRKTMAVANETNSKVLVANAWHHRVDSLTSMVALVTISGAYLFNVAWIDSIGGLFVSILIIKTGWGSFLSSWYELVDRGEDPSSEIYTKIMGITKKEVAEVAGSGFDIAKLSVLTSGANSNIYVTLVENQGKDYSLKELNAIELKLVEAMKREDKFIKNIFILFKYNKEA
ncbi:mitochondrial metal transporter 1 [[Candida] railenensis]|uniref:Mitochondrial metal transporter 1 n=1 Tax=[Candida] railenensis TaxID=45579 RepID=A0A9P0VVL3_9ASCO|nr:mitochondrial metal transporter 1 [[Candida] railenensis]